MDESVRNKAEIYAEQQQIEIGRKLGFGWDGTVFATSRQSAIKMFKHERLYQRERDVYLRLHERRVVRVFGFDVPQLIDFDDDLWIVEMTIVSPPFVLDFAGAYLGGRRKTTPQTGFQNRSNGTARFGKPGYKNTKSFFLAP